MSNLDKELHVREIDLSAGGIRYRDAGQGPPILFIHGLLVNGELWRKVAAPLTRGFRCISPDWPMGSHAIPMKPDADLSPRALAGLVNEFLDALELNDVTLVANDTGGAVAQLLLADGCDRVGRVVLTPCDSFDNFLPPVFRPMQYLARVPGGLTAALQPLRLRRLRRLPVAFGWLAKRPVPDEITDGWLKPFFTSRGVRRDTACFVRAIDKRDTLEAAGQLGSFKQPVLLVWSREDRFFPFEHAQRWAEIFPNGRLAEVTDSYAFVSEDQPEVVARLIADFAREGTAVAG